MANPSIDNLNPQFYSQLVAFVRASNGLVTLEGGSGYRSFEQQARLYANWKAGVPGQAQAAPPGKSQHNHGLAFDLKFPGGQRGRKWAADNAARFGLHFPVPGEDWHVEPIWGRDASKGQSPAQFMSSTMDLGFQPLNPAQAKDAAKSLYGYLGWFVDHPEIGSILIDAAMNGWDTGRLQGALSKTKWWKTTSESARQWDALLISDNATAARRIQETQLSLTLEAQQLGIRVDRNRLYSMSVNALRLGWNEDEMRLALTAEMRWDPRRAQGGQVGKLMSDVEKLGAEYMVPVNERQSWEWARRMVGGAADINAVEQQLKILAGARFPHLTQQISNGVTPGQFFTPHRNTVAELLEIPVDEVDLMSEEWLPVTSFSDPKTGQVRPMSFSELERYTRGRSEWANTDNAWEMVTEAGDVLTQIFGEMAT